MTTLVLPMGRPALLLWRVLVAAWTNGLPRRGILIQMNKLGSATGLLVTFGMGFFGMVVTTIAYAQARKYTGNITILGPAYFELMVREFAPMLTALLAASRCAASISAELGAMSVNEQVEALELSAAHPLAELVAPRLFASLLVMPALNIIGTVAACASAALTVSYAFGADGWAFVDPQFLDANDVFCSLLKGLVCGAYVPLVAAWHGLRAKGGAAAVGEAVTVGVVEACMGCLLLDFAVAAVFLVVGA